MADMFRRLYLDTNVLYDGWPSLSTRVKALFLRAQQLKIELSIPAPVERELRRQMQTRIVEAVASFETAHEKLLNLVSSFDDDLEIDLNAISLPEVMNLQNAMRKYDDACESAKRKWEIRPVPFSSEGVEFFFGLANERTPPFKNVGKDKKQAAGFQDAVILWSIYADVERSPECPCALLTLDGDFKRESINRTLANRGSVLQLYQCIEEVLASLDEHMEVHLRKALSERESLVHLAVLKNTNAMEGQIARKLTLDQMNVLVSPLFEVLSCSRFSFQQIEAVIVADPMTEDEQARLEASLTICGELWCDELGWPSKPLKTSRRVWLEIDLEIVRSKHDNPSITVKAIRPSFVHREIAQE